MPGHVRITRWIAFAVIAAGELMLVFGPWLLAALRWLADKDADWWGAAGQWAGALGSVAAVVVALWIARKGARDAAQIAQQGADEAAARELRRQRALAMQVHGEFRLIVPRYVVSIFNNSDHPVVDVRVVEATGVESVPITPSSGDHWPVHSVLKPHQSVDIPLKFSRTVDESLRGMQNSPEYSIVIEFTDIEGYRWRREGEGLPEHLA